MHSFFWWLLQIFLALLALFFLLFGVHLLIGAYHLKDPFSFVMTFFASNLIILINATLLLGFILRMVKGFRNARKEKMRAE